MTDHFPVAARGKHNIELAHQFLERFPLSEDLNNPTKLTADEFDEWAIHNRLFDTVNIADKDALNMARNALRYRINNIASGDPWRERRNASFEIGVARFAKRDETTLYHVRVALAGFLHGGPNLTKKIKRTAEGRKQQLERLYDAADFSKLPLRLQVQAALMLEQIDQWSVRADVDLNQLEGNFQTLRHQIKHHAPEVARLIQNHDEHEGGDDD